MFCSLLQLRTIPQGARRQIGKEMKKDLVWFLIWAERLNCRCLLITDRQVYKIECDACPRGGGGFSEDRELCQTLAHITD